MRWLLRLLGVAAVAQAGSHLPSPVSRVLSAVLLVGANLLPVAAVLDGRMGMGEVFLLYWLENVIVWLTTTVKIVTARGPQESGAVGAGQPGSGTPTPQAGATALGFFFALHFGMFTLVHGVFTAILAGMAGLRGSLLAVLWIALAILASHLVSLGLNWFGRDERSLVTPGRAMAAPYPRMLALHVAIIGSTFLLLDGPGSSTADEAGAVALLCLGKTVVDLGFHLHERRSAGHPGRLTLRANGRVIHRS